MITFSQLGRYGRFANQAYQIASTIGLATYNGYDYSFPLWINHDHKDRFGSDEDIEIYKHLANPLPHCDDPYKYPERFIQWGYHGMQIPDNHSLLGHMQSPRYFAHCIDLIRHHFTFKDEYPPNDRVLIHYRAGDYQHGPDSYHPRQPIEYYRAAMAQFPGREFSIVTDDMIEAESMFPDIPISSGTTIDDFKFMKSHHSFIIANSSYSAFAATIANQPDKKVIAPRLWFGRAANGLDGSAIYEPNWIVI